MAQAAQGLLVGHQLLGQLRRRAAQQVGQLGVLPGHGGPAGPHPAVVLPAVQQGGQLPVHLSHIVPEMKAPVGEPPGKIPRPPPAPGQDSGQGVVHGIHGAGIVLLPAVLPPGAVPAHLGRRPAEDHGGVPVIVRRAEGGIHRLVQAAKGGRRPLHPLSDQLLGLQIRPSPGLRWGHPGPQAAQHPARQQQKQGTARQSLIQHAAGDHRRRPP